MDWIKIIDVSICNNLLKKISISEVFYCKSIWCANRPFNNSTPNFSPFFQVYVIMDKKTIGAKKTPIAIYMDETDFR